MLALPFALSTAFAADAPALSDEAKAASGKTYFERCAGCHGMLRKGATGKNLEPKNTSKLGNSRLEKIMSYGTEGGMPNFDDILSKDEIKNMAAYIQMPPDAPPVRGSVIGSSAAGKKPRMANPATKMSNRMSNARKIRRSVRICSSFTANLLQR